MKTKYPIQSVYLHNFIHPPNTEAKIVEIFDKSECLVELRVPDESLVGGFWFEWFELSRNDLNE